MVLFGKVDQCSVSVPVLLDYLGVFQIHTGALYGPLHFPDNNNESPQHTFLRHSMADFWRFCQKNFVLDT